MTRFSAIFLTKKMIHCLDALGPGINERIAKLLPDGAVMPHNSEMVMISVDCNMSKFIDFHVTEINLNLNFSVCCFFFVEKFP